MRLLRKILLDIKYSENDNNLYTNIIINNNDFLSEIKNNPLINNLEYPTELLNFLYGFHNITAKCSIKEKIKNKHTLQKERLKNLKSLMKVDLFTSKQIVRSTTITNFNHLNKYNVNIELNNINNNKEEENEINNIKQYFSSKKIKKEQDNQESQDEEQNINSNSNNISNNNDVLMSLNKSKKKFDKNLKIKNDTIFEENSQLNDSSDDEKILSKRKKK